MPAKQAPCQRSPNGVASRKPIGLRLMPDELARLRRHARELNCSYALFARRMVIRGMAAYEQDQANASRTLSDGSPAVSIRGERS